MLKTVLFRQLPYFSSLNTKGIVTVYHGEKVIKMSRKNFTTSAYGEFERELMVRPGR